MLIRVVKPSYLRIFTCPKPPIRYLCDKKDDDKSKTIPPDEKKKAKVTSAADRLNELLAGMSTVDNTTLKKIDIPKPKKRSKKQVQAESSESSDDETKKPKNIVEAARKVAETIEGDQKQTEMELLSKLLGIPLKDDKKGKANLSDVISGMQITKEEPLVKPDPSRAEFVRKALREHDDRQRTPSYPRERQERRPRSTEPVKMVSKVDLFGTEPLGIFTKTDAKPSELLETWDFLEKRELRLAVTHPPSNYFEKMAIWTEQGKLWRFPIDNEQDIGPEAEVDFTEHIFLEELLDPWCPKKGPIRHFMELVTVGLSKNAFLTVQEKHAHINYYKEYFESKKELLKQIIVETKKEEPKEVSSQ